MNRTDAQKALDYTALGHSVTVITNLIAGDADVIGDMTEAYRKEKVKRKKKGKQGGQKGHKGRTLKQVENPDLLPSAKHIHPVTASA